MRTILMLSLAVVAGQPLSAQSTCKVEGVWQLVSGTANGKSYPATTREMKIITKGHFAFVSEGQRGVMDLKTVADTLAAFRTMASGGGTYTVRGNAYTEKVEYFYSPAYVGKSIAFTCRTEGDRFYQSGAFPILEN